jgi:hypothetical protein
MENGRKGVNGRKKNGKKHSAPKAGKSETGMTEVKKYCFQIEFDKVWGTPRYIYVVAETMEQACEYACKVKNWQQEIETCKLMGLAP